MSGRSIFMVKSKTYAFFGVLLQQGNADAAQSEGEDSDCCFVALGNTEDSEASGD